MGDSCFNPGMKSITKEAGLHHGVYATCIPTGDNEITDTLAGFLTTMDKSVDIFAAKIRKDPKLAGGFNAFGLSQGNNLIHGYQLKYNDPPVVSFVSICGINAGVGAIPECSPNGSIPIIGPVLGRAANCRVPQDPLAPPCGLLGSSLDRKSVIGNAPALVSGPLPRLSALQLLTGLSPQVLGPVCSILAEAAGDAANTKIIQDILFQANYYRDPVALNTTDFQRYNELAQWNGEGAPGSFNQTFKENFLKTSTNVWVKGLKDTVVWPSEGEWWGQVCP